MTFNIKLPRKRSNDTAPTVMEILTPGMLASLSFMVRDSDVNVSFPNVSLWWTINSPRPLSWYRGDRSLPLLNFLTRPALLTPPFQCDSMTTSKKSFLGIGGYPLDYHKVGVLGGRGALLKSTNTQSTGMHTPGLGGEEGRSWGKLGRHRWTPRVGILKVDLPKSTER